MNRTHDQPVTIFDEVITGVEGKELINDTLPGHDSSSPRRVTKESFGTLCPCQNRGE